MNDSSVEAALARCAEAAADPQPDPVRALAAIVAWLRPARDEPPAAAGERLARLIDHLATPSAATTFSLWDLFKAFLKRLFGRR